MSEIKENGEPIQEQSIERHRGKPVPLIPPQDSGSLNGQFPVFIRPQLEDILPN